MKCLLSLFLFAVAGVLVADERTVLVPTDTTPFTAQQSETVRIVAKGISGSKIEAKVEGPAKIETTSILRELKNGKSLIGSQVREFDLKLTGKGEVTVTVTVTPPQPNVKPIITKYQFDVK